MEKIRKGKIENERMENNFYVCLIVDRKIPIYKYNM